MYPPELRYTTEHEWVARVGADVVRFGVTSYAQQALGDVVFVELPEVGQELVAGDPCGEVESTKSVSDLFSPVDGEVVAVNADLAESPELVNAEPYGEGWMVEVRCADPGALDDALESLLSAADYEAQLP